MLTMFAKGTGAGETTGGVDPRRRASLSAILPRRMLVFPTKTAF